MRRPRRALLAAVPLAVLLAACGSGEATQGSVHDDVLEALRDDAASENPRFDLGDGEAEDLADCVADGMFEGDFTPDERNDVTRASDGDEPDPELVAKVQDLVDGCLEGEPDEG